MSPTTKGCTKCTKTKPITAYTPDRLQKGGIYPVCRDCRNAAVRERRARRKAGLPPLARGRKPKPSGWHHVSDVTDEQSVVRVSKVERALEKYEDFWNERAAGLR